MRRVRPRVADARLRPHACRPPLPCLLGVSRGTSRPRPPRALARGLPAGAPCPLASRAQRRSRSLRDRRSLAIQGVVAMRRVRPRVAELARRANEQGRQRMSRMRADPSATGASRALARGEASRPGTRVTPNPQPRPRSLHAGCRLVPVSLVAVRDVRPRVADQRPSSERLPRVRATASEPHRRGGFWLITRDNLLGAERPGRKRW